MCISLLVNAVSMYEIKLQLCILFKKYNSCRWQQADSTSSGTIGGKSTQTDFKLIEKNKTIKREKPDENSKKCSELTN